MYLCPWLPSSRQVSSKPVPMLLCLPCFWARQTTIVGSQTQRVLLSGFACWPLEGNLSLCAELHLHARRKPKGPLSWHPSSFSWDSTCWRLHVWIVFSGCPAIMFGEVFYLLFSFSQVVIEASLGHFKSCPAQNSFNVSRPKIASMSLLGARQVMFAQLHLWTWANEKWLSSHHTFTFLLRVSLSCHAHPLMREENWYLGALQNFLAVFIFCQDLCRYHARLWYFQVLEMQNHEVPLNVLAWLVSSHLLLGNHCQQQLWLFLEGQVQRALLCSIFSEAKWPRGFPSDSWDAWQSVLFL